MAENERGAKAPGDLMEVTDRDGKSCLVRVVQPDENVDNESHHYSVDLDLESDKGKGNAKESIAHIQTGDAKQGHADSDSGANMPQVNIGAPDSTWDLDEIVGRDTSPSSSDSLAFQSQTLGIRVNVLPLFLSFCVSDDGSSLYATSNPINHNQLQQNTQAMILNNLAGNLFGLEGLPTPSLNNDKMVAILGMMVSESCAGVAADNVVELAPAGTDNNAKCINTESSYVDLCPSLKSVTSILSNALCDLDGCSLFDKTTYERIAAVFGIDKEGRHFKDAMSCDDLFEGAHHMLLSKCMLTRDDGISSVPSVNNLVILFVEGMNRAEVTRCLCCASCYDSSGVIAPGSISAESFKVGLSLDSLQVQKCPQPLEVLRFGLADSTSSVCQVISSVARVEVHSLDQDREPSHGSVQRHFLRQSQIISSSKQKSSAQSPFQACAEAAKCLVLVQELPDYPDNSTSGFLNDPQFRHFARNPSFIATAIPRCLVHEDVTPPYRGSMRNFKTANSNAKAEKVHDAFSANTAFLLPVFMKYVFMACKGNKVDEAAWLENRDGVLPMLLVVMKSSTKTHLESHITSPTCTDSSSLGLFSEKGVRVLANCGDDTGMCIRVSLLLTSFAIISMHGKNPLHEVLDVVTGARASARFVELHIVKALGKLRIAVSKFDLTFVSSDAVWYLLHFTTDTITSFLGLEKKDPDNRPMLKFRKNYYWLVYLTVCNDLLKALVRFGLFPNTQNARWPGLNTAHQSRSEFRQFVVNSIEEICKTSKKKWKEFLIQLFRAEHAHSTLSSCCLAFCVYLCRLVSSHLKKDSDLLDGADVSAVVRTNLLPKLNGKNMTEFSQFKIKDIGSFESFLGVFLGQQDSQLANTMLSVMDSISLSDEIEQIEQEEDEEGPKRKKAKKTTGAMDSSAIPQLWDAIISVNDLSSQPGAQPELVSASDALVVAANALVPAGKNSFIEHEVCKRRSEDSDSGRGGSDSGGDLSEGEASGTGSVLLGGESDSGVGLGGEGCRMNELLAAAHVMDQDNDSSSAQPSWSHLEQGVKSPLSEFGDVSSITTLGRHEQNE